MISNPNLASTITRSKRSDLIVLATVIVWSLLDDGVGSNGKEDDLVLIKAAFALLYLLLLSLLLLLLVLGSVFFGDTVKENLNISAI